MSENRNQAAVESFRRGSSPVVDGAVSKSAEIEALTKAFVQSLLKLRNPETDLSVGATAIHQQPLSEAILAPQLEGRGSDTMRAPQRNRNFSVVSKAEASQMAAKALCHRHHSKSMNKSGEGFTNCRYCRGMGFEKAVALEQKSPSAISNQPRELQTGQE